MSKTVQVSNELKELAKTFKGIAIINDKMIRISFTFDGKRENVTLKDWDITKNNLIAASHKLSAIKYDIANDCFSWGKHFPTHAKAITASGIEKVPTVQKAIEDWIGGTATGKRRLTNSTYSHKATKHIYPKFGSVLASQIKVTDIEKWRFDELSYLKNKTINEILIPFRGAFKNLAKDRLIEFNPFDHIKNLKVKASKDDSCDPFSTEEIALIQSTPTQHKSELNGFIFACWSGMRVSEWLALAWEDIDLVNRKAKVRRGIVQSDYQATKTDGSYRTIDLIEPAYEALVAQKRISFMLSSVNVSVLDDDNRHFNKESLRFVFPKTCDNEPYRDVKHFSANFFTHHLKKCSIRHRGVNQARHTFASLALTAGIRERWIATTLGHTTLAMLEKHYATFMDDELPDMAERASMALGYKVTTKAKLKLA